MENTISDYARRKVLRIKLNNKRNKDKDHSANRYIKDATILNRAMKIYKIEGQVANW